MKIFKKQADLQKYLKQYKTTSIGFCPTMGALHAGHISLLEHSIAENEINVVSIFVNPTQFNDKSDLDKYPRPIEKDIQMLLQNKCDILFLPDVNEIYPEDYVKIEFDLNDLDKEMEGRFRPGHFEGVTEVVHRLLEIVQPDKLYMGQKDFQQFVIIKHLLQITASPTKIIMVPIVREKDGLAMSSRNIRLSPQGRKKAVMISKILFQAKLMALNKSLSDVLAFTKKEMRSQDLDYEYVELVDCNSLTDVSRSNPPSNAAICVVVRIDGVRLLDNLILR